MPFSFQNTYYKEQQQSNPTYYTSTSTPSMFSGFAQPQYATQSASTMPGGPFSGFAQPQYATQSASTMPGGPFSGFAQPQYAAPPSSSYAAPPSSYAAPPSSSYAAPPSSSSYASSSSRSHRQPKSTPPQSNWHYNSAQAPWERPQPQPQPQPQSYWNYNPSQAPWERQQPQSASTMPGGPFSGFREQPQPQSDWSSSRGRPQHSHSSYRAPSPPRRAPSPPRRAPSPPRSGPTESEILRTNRPPSGTCKAVDKSVNVEKYSDGTIKCIKPKKKQQMLIIHPDKNIECNDYAKGLFQFYNKYDECRPSGGGRKRKTNRRKHRNSKTRKSRG